MASNICKKCGKENEPDFKFCAFCGEKLPYLVCSNCGELYNKDYKFCGKCGGKLLDNLEDDIDTKVVKKDNSDNKTNKINKSDIEIFYLNYKNKYTARGMETDDGFLLFKGAIICEDIVKSALPHIINSREKNKSKIKDGVTTEDILFKSSSGAASFVAGSNLSGPKYWIPKSGKVNRTPSKKRNGSSKKNSPIFYLKSKDYYGKGTYDEGKFILFEGAKLNQFVAPRAQKQVLTLRKKNKSKIENFVTTDKILFNSPSSAANFISGTMMNGRKEWKNRRGKSINDLQKK